MNSSSSEIHRIQSPTAHGPENLTVTGPDSRGLLHWITSKGHFQLTGFCGSRIGNKKTEILGSENGNYGISIKAHLCGSNLRKTALKPAMLHLHFSINFSLCLFS